MRGFIPARLLGALVLVLAAGFSAACAGASIDRVMEASGMRHALMQVAPTILQSLDTPQPGAEIPPYLRAALKEAAAQAFKSDRIIDGVRAQLTRELGEREIREVLSWLETPFGKRITELEMRAADPAALARIESYARELQRRAPAKSRRLLIQDLNVATRSTETGLALMEAIVYASALGVNAAQSKQTQVPAEHLQREIRKALPGMRAEAEAQVTATLFYTYRTLTDRELGAYLAFLQSESGFAYARAGSDAIRDALTQAISLYMTAIPPALQRAQASGRT
jgi:hypothetical protein